MYTATTGAKHILWVLAGRIFSESSGFFLINFQEEPDQELEVTFNTGLVEPLEKLVQEKMTKSNHDETLFEKWGSDDSMLMIKFDDTMLSCVNDTWWMRRWHDNVDDNAMANAATLTLETSMTYNRFLRRKQEKKKEAREGYKKKSTPGV